MASYYLDTNALVKLYVEEQGTDVVIQLTGDLNRDQLAILDLALLECRSMVRRRERELAITREDAERILDLVEDHGLSLYVVQPTTADVLREARRLLDGHPLRTLDALQLAGCLSIRQSVPPPLTFVCADTRLCEVASQEGVATLNPLEGGL